MTKLKETRDYRGHDVKGARLEILSFRLPQDTSRK